MSTNFKRNAIFGREEVYSSRPCSKKLHVRDETLAFYTYNKRSMHRIDLNNVIKVADFGLSEKIYSSKSYFRIEVAGQGGVKLPVKWMAIESLNDDIFSEKTDVVNCLEINKNTVLYISSDLYPQWSFGVTCWEVFTLGKGPYPGVDPFSLLRHLERGERLVKPANVACSEEM